MVLVTGAGGFIGSHLTEVLTRRGERVRALVHYNFQNNWGWLDTVAPDVREQVEVVPCDICDPFAVRDALKGCETVFHLAALISIPYSYRAPASFVETNVKGTLNVLEACRDYGVQRVVHTSTSETYGTAQYIPMDEKHPLVGQSPYSASKIAADKLAEAYHLSFGLPVVTVRPFNTFGPRQSARAVIPTIISQALSGAKTIKLGATTPVRDLNFVADTVDGFLRASETPAAIGRVVNLGRGDGISVEELAKKILNLCDSDAEIEVEEDRIRPEKSEVMELVCDNRLAKDLLGWRPKHSLEDGLRNTVEWMRRHLDRYKPHLYNE